MLSYAVSTLFSIYLINNFVTTEDAVEKFSLYKKKYNRVYKSEKNEMAALNNFLDNMNKVSELNNQTRSKTDVYQLNRFADQNPEDVNEHFGIHIQPYDYVINDTKNINETNKRQTFLEDMNLYDLYKVDNLYKQWAKKWRKSNYTKKYDRTVHYYRFVKTVAEINKKKFEGENVDLDADADIVQEPTEYFYR